MEEIKSVDLRAMSLEELLLKVDELSRELFQLRLRVATTPVRTFSSDQYKLKKSIARTWTEIRQRSFTK